ncbi:alpha/beta fold hydrolase [Frankia sp. AgPm24]|uniref:thioesterase II family protein n=1 Tax=Frankia sp. AgPm24 TaxID=631128 RepID=UPI00200E5CEE|nr:alpha/beta fold hydrolase [Frankia sp. AgPm24]MCK9925471.1 alpha/beta fold hydrolase [Frankia sp. AgPm24]
MTAPGRAWLRAEPASPAATRLLLLAHSGAGAASFTRWLGLFGPGVGLVRVQLPGREDAAAETLARRLPEVVDPLLAELAPLTNAPLALYGHSMGALVAFELARALTAAGTAPVHLFVSGRRAPHQPNRRPRIDRLPDDEFVTALERLGAAERVARTAAFLRYAIRVTRADLELSEEYDHRSVPRLACPITGFHGDNDLVVDRDQVEAWQAETDGPFVLRTFPGTHFFHQEHRAAIAQIMSEALTGKPATEPVGTGRSR